MLDGLLNGLLTAWFLRMFEIDIIFIGALQPFFVAEITVNHYYFVFGIIGCIGGLVKIARGVI